ncbi:hypothetical protein B1B04_22200 [Lysinibacillus sp. KCTC 33748]|uniref:hypothetical protein n=1 Tax=unclassified Lysinibacillus TaxID=2636778 RepID=UPI0009A5AFF8|nr:MULTISPECIES: hypothetical protein [unclassified Lysinibacillus]OXS67506.1 hypothetical protein B1B04_22200 [Lysinibacillus sp. KCTC 33748]SKC14344.1 hypothetical protein SAMN06295926_1286 [Lysinibacillus sp. AC-3]
MEKTFGEQKDQKLIGFSLLGNGADSIKGAHSCIEKLDDLVDGIAHNLKDAVIFLNHGIEILLKVMLAERSAALMFTNIKDYQKAKESLKKGNKKDVFEVDPNLQTVSLKEALARIEFLCDVEIDDNMRNAIFELNKIRNKLMHFSLSFNEQEVSELIETLKFCYTVVCDFFEVHIEKFNDYVDDSRYEYTIEEYQQDQAEWHAELMMEDMKLFRYE